MIMKCDAKSSPDYRPFVSQLNRYERWLHTALSAGQSAPECSRNEAHDSAKRCNLNKMLEFHGKNSAAQRQNCLWLLFSVSLWPSLRIHGEMTITASGFASVAYHAQNEQTSILAWRIMILMCLLFRIG